jgi:hypothetical protein
MWLKLTNAAGSPILVNLHKVSRIQEEMIFSEQQGQTPGTEIWFGDSSSLVLVKESFEDVESAFEVPPK